jgi:hypothetical protein
MMTVYRAPIQTEEVVPGQQEDTRPRTRCGYLVPEAYSCYETALGETGAVASGKALHFAADIICSGGIDIWIRGAYSYAVQHISLANPRIFVYLKQRIQELDAHALRLPEESFYSNPDVQNTIGEVVLVLQLCPKRTKLVWPRVDPNTKRQGWLRGVAGAPETRATRLVWTSDGDTPPLYLVANELCKAIAEGGSESALFWIKWVLEEDARVRKETKGHGLSTKERGPATLPPKQRSDAGHFVAELLGIIYKEFAAQNLLRMHEEFGELMRLWRNGEKRMAVRLRRDCLGLMCLIVCEVPRWKVPAAPSLISDPVRLSRAVGQTSSFFNEVLAHKALSAGKQLKPTMTKGRKANTKAAGVATEKEKKALSLEEHFDAYDAAMEAYLNRA